MFYSLIMNRLALPTRGRSQLINFILPFRQSLSTISNKDTIKQNRRKHKKLRQIPITTYANADKLPSLLIAKDAYITNTYGVHNQHGIPFLGYVLIRGKYNESNVTFPRGKPQTKIGLNSETKVLTIDTAFYISYLQFNNFGHMLTETVSNIYPLIQWKIEQSDMVKLPIVINEPLSCDDHQIEELCKLLEISSDQIIRVKNRSDTIHIKNLLKASPSHINRNFASRHHSSHVKKFLKLYIKTNPDELSLQEKINKNKDTAFSKLYISRSKLNKSLRSFSLEIELERELEKLGWSIYHPEEHSLMDQISTYQSAKLICATEGSALHLIFGIKINNLQKVIILCKNKKNNFSKQLSSQRINFECHEIFAFAKGCKKELPLRDVELKEKITISQVIQMIDNSYRKKARIQKKLALIARRIWYNI